MRICLFYHSLLSDWNHGNAHFLRGIATELIERGNDVKIYEPKNAWSLQNLLNDYGAAAVDEFYKYYPSLKSIQYDLSSIDLDSELEDADLVIVHEWNDHGLVSKIGKKKKYYRFKLLFHDTHHRALTETKSMSAYDLSNYDGVLAYGKCIRDIYLKKKWSRKAWVWHEAADTRIFKPLNKHKEGDLVWIGNWGDEERTKELFEFLINPSKQLNLETKIYGVRYPSHAKAALKDAGIKYGGWLPNYKAPEEFAKYSFTVHVPRRPYVESLPGIPTIRPFEALACGIPMISSPWDDVEHLFTPGKDFLVARNGNEMKQCITRLLNDDGLAGELAAHGLKTIQERHTCSHRVDELYHVCEDLGIKNITNPTIA
jgi:spore maturation protein CgeB